jgi:hypothetical protein
MQCRHCLCASGEGQKIDKRETRKVQDGLLAAGALEFTYVREKGKKKSSPCCVLLLQQSRGGRRKRGQRLLREAQHHNKLSRWERARHASKEVRASHGPDQREKTPAPCHTFIMSLERANAGAASTVNNTRATAMYVLFCY